MGNRWIGYFAGIGSAVIMGFSWYATKRIGQLCGASVFDILCVRYIISGSVFLCGWKLRMIHLDYRGKAIRPLLLLSLLMPVIYNILEYSALSYITSAEIGMLCSLSTVVAPLLGWLLLKERVSAREGAFMVIAIAGVVLTNLFEFDLHSSSNIGRLLMCGCVLCSSFNRVLSRRASSAFTSTEITAVMMWESALVMTLLAVGSHLWSGTLEEFGYFLRNTQVYGYLLFLSLGCSLLGFLLNNVSIANLPMSRSSVLATISTIVAVISGAVLLREPLEWYDYLGCGIIVLGVTGCNISKHKGGEVGASTP